MDVPAKASLLRELSKAIAETEQAKHQGPFEPVLLRNQAIIMKTLKALLEAAE